MFDFDKFAKDVAEKAPFKPGWSQSNEQRLDSAFDIPTAQFEISSAPSLAYLQSDFVLFNHGALVKFSPTPGDPLRRFCTFNRLSGPVFTLSSPFPILSGLGEPWDSMIVGCAKADWSAISKYLDTDTALIRDKGLLVRPLAQTQFPVVDFLSMGRRVSLPDNIPIVLIEIYGIDSNKQCMHFRPSVSPMLSLPKLIVEEPIPETVLIAERVLAGKENPFEHRFKS